MKERLQALYVATGLSRGVLKTQDGIREIDLPEPYRPDFTRNSVMRPQSELPLIGCYMLYKFRRGTTVDELRAAANRKLWHQKG
jgi:hypothetical protein